MRTIPLVALTALLYWAVVAAAGAALRVHASPTDSEAPTMRPAGALVAGINYNPSKSNTGNLAAPKKKGGKHASEPSHGAMSGKRRH